MEKLIIALLRLFCPYLRAMAKNTGSPVDDIIVNVLCRAVGNTEEDPTEGGLKP